MTIECFPGYAKSAYPLRNKLRIHSVEGRRGILYLGRGGGGGGGGHEPGTLVCNWIVLTPWPQPTIELDTNAFIKGSKLDI